MDFLNLDSNFPSNAWGRRGNSKCQMETPTLRYSNVMVLERQSQSRNFLRPLQPKSWHILKLDYVINYFRNTLILFLIAFNLFGGKQLSTFFKTTFSPQTLTKMNGEPHCVYLLWFRIVHITIRNLHPLILFSLT